MRVTGGNKGCCVGAPTSVSGSGGNKVGNNGGNNVGNSAATNGHATQHRRGGRACCLATLLTSHVAVAAGGPLGPGMATTVACGVMGVLRPASHTASGPAAHSYGSTGNGRGALLPHWCGRFARFGSLKSPCITARYVAGRKPLFRKVGIVRVTGRLPAACRPAAAAQAASARRAGPLRPPCPVPLAAVGAAA